MTEDDKALVEELRINDREIYLPVLGKSADRIEALSAENERLRDWALRAFTVVEWVCGEGWVLDAPQYNPDDLLCDGVELLGVYSSDDVRAALGER